MDNQTPLRRRIYGAGNVLVESFHLLGLFAIGGATVWAAATAFMVMAQKGTATVEDLLLLFIYLEIGAMVGIYFQTNQLPVRFLIYVAITALTRHMVAVVNIHENPVLDILIMAAGILILALSALVLRYGTYIYPSRRRGFAGEDEGKGKGKES